MVGWLGGYYPYLSIKNKLMKEGILNEKRKIFI